MKFSRQVFAKAIAIVNMFETSRTLGNFAALAVQNDGAGISYGAGQFTHRSGSLAKVIEKYLELGGTYGKDVFTNSLDQLRDTSEGSLAAASKNETLKNALRAAASTEKMRSAQLAVQIENYAMPAERLCERNGWELPLTFAVVFDSMVHGSWKRIADQVGAPRSNEKQWIGEYVKRREAWLGSIPRLRNTRYRTQFFSSEIERGNWNLEQPITPHGVRVSDEAIALIEKAIPIEQLAFGFEKDLAAGPAESSANTAQGSSDVPAETSLSDSRPPDGITQKLLRIEECVDDTAEKYDRVEAAVLKITRRSDSAKSLWTTIAGTFWQTIWAIAGLVAGIPREIWLVVAVVAAGLTFIYLYRQIALGKIRERQGVNSNA